jgi:tRNA G18 (ribose-2'-O)-methylase SpoU
LVVGSEAHGLDEAALAACAERVTLPMPGGTESLNAAMAGAIACYALFAANRR